MGLMHWDGGNDPLESPYRAKELIYTGLANDKAKAAMESQMAANAYRGGPSDPGAGQVSMGGFGGAEAGRQAARDSLSLSQTQGERENWAGGREIQHDRNLQNAEQDRRMYDSQTARYVSDNNLRAQQSLASSLGAGLFQTPNIQGMANQAPGTTMYGPGGQTIGGSGMGGALSGLNAPAPQQQQRQAPPPPPPPRWR